MKKSNEMYCIKFLNGKGKSFWMYIKTYAYINKKNVFIRKYPPVMFIKKDHELIYGCDIIIDNLVKRFYIFE